MFEVVNINTDFWLSDDTPKNWDQIPLTDIQKAVLRGEVIKHWQDKADQLLKQIDNIDKPKIPIYFKGRCLDNSARYIVSAILKYCHEAIPEWSRPTHLIEKTSTFTLQG